MKYFVFIFGLFICICTTNAQELSIKKVTLLPNDKTALEAPCLDFNGDTCALVKIKIPGVEGLEFSNKTQYIKCSFVDDVYMIYVPTISRRLDYKHSDFLPGRIDLGEFGYKRLKAGKTYMVQMEVPSNAKNGSLLIIKVNPVSARVSFDGSQVGLSSTGIYEFNLREGSYKYAISMDDYMPLEGTVQIGKNENKSCALSLKPIMHTVKVDCNVRNSHVFIDNVDYGETGMLSLPQGNHRIRIQKDGYLDIEENVDIQGNMRPLSYSLKKNKNIKEVHATPVRVFSNSSRIYKNNKELEDWNKSGDVVLIMPGKYEISDDNGAVKRVEVGADSLEVYLGEKETFVGIERNSSSYSTQQSLKGNSRYNSNRSTYNPTHPTYNPNRYSYNQNRSYSYPTRSTNTSRFNYNYNKSGQGSGRQLRNVQQRARRY